MTDFGDGVRVITPVYLSAWSRYSAVMDHAGMSAGFPANTSWATANKAIYVPFFLPFAYPVKRVFWVNGSSALSNVDFGIYDKSGNRIYSTGSTAQSGASAAQYVTPTPFLLSPGDYYFALNCNSASASRLYARAADSLVRGRLAGILEQTSAFPLPATMTPAALSAAVSAFPLIGVTRT